MLRLRDNVQNLEYNHTAISNVSTDFGDWLYIVDDKDLIFPVVISDYIKQCEDAELIDEDWLHGEVGDNIEVGDLVYSDEVNIISCGSHKSRLNAIDQINKQIRKHIIKCIDPLVLDKDAELIDEVLYEMYDVLIELG